MHPGQAEYLSFRINFQRNFEMSVLAYCGGTGREKWRFFASKTVMGQSLFSERINSILVFFLQPVAVNQANIGTQMRIFWILRWVEAIKGTK